MTLEDAIRTLVQAAVILQAIADSNRDIEILNPSREELNKAINVANARIPMTPLCSNCGNRHRKEVLCA